MYFSKITRAALALALICSIASLPACGGAAPGIHQTGQLPSPNHDSTKPPFASDDDAPTGEFESIGLKITLPTDPTHAANLNTPPAPKIGTRAVNPGGSVNIVLFGDAVTPNNYSPFVAGVAPSLIEASTIAHTLNIPIAATVFIGYRLNDVFGDIRQIEIDGNLVGDHPEAFCLLADGVAVAVFRVLRDETGTISFNWGSPGNPRCGITLVDTLQLRITGDSLVNGHPDIENVGLGTPLAPISVQTNLMYNFTLNAAPVLTLTPAAGDARVTFTGVPASVLSGGRNYFVTNSPENLLYPTDPFVVATNVVVTAGVFLDLTMTSGGTTNAAELLNLADLDLGSGTYYAYITTGYTAGSPYVTQGADNRLNPTPVN